MKSRTTVAKELSFARGAVTMRSILLLVLLIGVVYSENNVTNLSSLNNYENVLKFGKNYIAEIECLKKLDSLLKRKWSSDLNKIPTTDLGNLGKIWWQVEGSSFTKYNTYEEEWLMHDIPPAKRIEQCFRNLVPDVVPFMKQSEIDCLNELFMTHVVREIDHQDEFEKILKNTSREQPPFRTFISFVEFVDVMFQNRNPDAMTDLERVLYVHAETYLIDEKDKFQRNLVGVQDCDWVNARALRETTSEERKFKEFVSQVSRSVDKQIGSFILKKWNLNETIPRERYDRWLLVRIKMLKNLEKEVENLRKQKKDAQWLCAHATRLAVEFSKEQLDILLTDDKYLVHFQVSDVASRARAIERALGKLNDFRHSAIKVIADEYAVGTRCLFSMLHLVQNQRKYDIASAFMNEGYSYPEVYCGNKPITFGLVQLSFCNCIGSFCVAHPLAALFADEYVMAKGADGIYQVVRSGKKSKRKIRHCHIMSNSKKISQL